MKGEAWLRARTLQMASGALLVTLEDALEAIADRQPDREDLVAALNALPDHYFATGIEYGDIREMADEMLARWDDR